MDTQTLFVGTAAGLARYSQHNRTWQRESIALDNQPVLALTVVDAAIVLANVDGATYASFDGGATWQTSTNAPPAPLGALVATVNGPQPVVHPRLAGATAYARTAGKSPMLLGAGAGGTMLFRSYDDGIHWEPAGMSAMVGRITAIIPAGDKQHAAWAGSDQGALLRSDDGGQNWHVVAHEPAPILCLGVTRQLR